MPTVSAARGCSPTARRRRPIGVLNTTTYVTGISTIAAQIIPLALPSTPRSASNRKFPTRGIPSSEPVSIVGIPSRSVGVPSVP